MKLDLNNAVFQNADVDSTKLRRVHKSFFFFFFYSDLPFIIICVYRH